MPTVMRTDDDSQVHDEPRPPPSTKEAQAAMDVLQRYSLCLESTDVAIQVTRVCSFIDAAIAQQKKQAKITDFLLVQCNNTVSTTVRMFWLC